MSIDVFELAALSKLSIGDGNLKDETVIRKEIESVVELMHLPEMEVPTELVEDRNPMTLRDDIPEKSLSRDEVLQNAPQKQAGCFVVPKTV